MNKNILRRSIAFILTWVLFVSSAFCTSAPVEAKRKSPKLSSSNITLKVGKTKQLKVKNTKAKVKWSSSNKKVASVSKSGIVKAKKKGKTTITAKVGKKRLKCRVKVIEEKVGKIKAVSARGDFTAILNTNGELWMCGRNAYGQLGDGSRKNRNRPVKIMTGVKSVSTGRNHTAILKMDGSLWTCGENIHGQLGDGSGTDRTKPVKIMTDVVDVSAGEAYTAILKRDGSLWMCGYNESKQLGNGSNKNQYKPVKVMSDVASVTAGWRHTAILKTDGSLWMCGFNGFEQLGIGVTEEYSEKSQGGTELVKSPITNVACVSLGWWHSAFVKTDGSLWMCGSNDCGRLGDGSSEYYRSSPVLVMNGVASVSAGFAFTAILKKDGSLWMCGDNECGQLGDGSRKNRNRSVKIMTGVKSVSTGRNHTVILKTDGSLWMCGNNEYGQFGNGHNKNLNIKPVKVM